MAGVVLVGAVVVAWARAGHTGSRKVSQAAAAAGLLTAVAASVTLAIGSEDEEGLIFALVVLGFPVLIAAVAAVAARATGPGAAAVGWGCAFLLFGYVLVFGLGPGLYFAPSALLVVTSMALRGDAGPSAPGPSPT